MFFILRFLSFFPYLVNNGMFDELSEKKLIMSSGIKNDKDSTKWMSHQSPKVSIMLSLGLSLFVLIWCFVWA